MQIQFALLITILCHNHANAILSDIIQLCNFVGCESEGYDNASTLNPEQNYKWMAAGLPLIFWDAVQSGSLFNQSIFSPACRDQLKVVRDGLLQDGDWAYKFIDSAGKTPAGLFRSTTATYGDYDQCLSIDSHGILGRYCMMDTYHLKKKTNLGQLNLSQRSSDFGYPFYATLCLPAVCTAPEIQEATRYLLKPHMIKVAGHVHCDTAEEISWYHKMTHLTGKQIAAMVMISVILFLTIIATGIDYISRREPTLKQDNAFHAMSIRSVSRKLFYAKPYTFEILLFDTLKLILISGAIIGHIIMCVDTPLSYATLSNLQFFNEKSSSYESQVMMTDTGLLAFSFLSGLALFSVLYPMIIQNRSKFSYTSAILDRIVRFLPAILILTACEFIWPIMGSGPFYTRVANFHHQKCERNWMYNVFFINNYFINGIDICAGHSFWSSVDMHLFLAGLLAMYIFSRSEFAGVLLSIVMITAGTVKVTYDSYAYQTPPALFYVDLDIFKTNEFFTVIYTKTTSYAPAYFAGMLVAYARSKGHLHLNLKGFWRNAFFVWLISDVVYAECFLFSLYNTFRIIDYSTSWIIVGLVRPLFIVGYAMSYIFGCSLKPLWDKLVSSKLSEEEKQKPVFHPFKALCRLTLSLYMCNYLYIRYEFYTRRFLYPNDGTWTLHRMLSSGIFVLLFALLFQILLLGPVDAMREILVNRMRAIRRPNNKQALSISSTRK